MQLLWTLTKKFNWTSLIYFTLFFHAVLISILISLEKEVKWLVGDPLQRYLEWCLLHFVCRKLLLQSGFCGGSFTAVPRVVPFTLRLQKAFTSKSTC